MTTSAHGSSFAADPGAPESPSFPVSRQDPLPNWSGVPVTNISIEGVSADRLKVVRDQLPQKSGVPLVQQDLAESLRVLFDTGLFDTIDAVGRRVGAGIALTFRGTPRYFIGTVTVDGARGATVNTQLERAARLNPGTRLTDAKLKASVVVMKEVLAQNGYFEASISAVLTQHTADQLTDIAVHVVSGPRARVGDVQVTGESGLSRSEFLEHAHLRMGATVDRDTVSRALSGLLKYYRGEHRLEAEIKLVSQSYSAHKVNYQFSAMRGPQVQVSVTGANLEKDDLKRLVPIFEEGTVDDDLLNEGNRRIRDYFQSLGYFDSKVDHTVDRTRPGLVLIGYHVNTGPRRKLERVSVTGNHYFGADTLMQLLSVHAADTFDRHGIYSQALIAADISAISGVYQNNGFSDVKVAVDTVSGPKNMVRKPGSQPTEEAAQGASQPAMAVIYRISEGAQQRVASVEIEGNANIPTLDLTSLINTEAGQLLSPRNLAGDRDTLTTEYLNRGFDQARVEVTQRTDPADRAKVDVTFRVTEGEREFVRNVLITGLHFTRPDTVQNAISLHPGDALSQTALQQTQRNLYEFALFNEVNIAVQNPGGGEAEKTVLVQAVEARRYTFTYGAGFEVQTGTPVNGCQGLTATGVKCTPNGRTGISPRILAAITRNNLFGREQSVSAQGNYGLLEQRVDLLYQNPHFLGKRNYTFTFTGGYANSQAVTTYVASRLEGGFRLTENFTEPNARFSRANTFIYGYDFRRVKVAKESLQVFPNFVDTLAAAVRVGGPSFTWVRDTRDSPVDAHRGTYTSFQEFLSSGPFGAEAQFNRVDVSNSSFYGFDKSRFVLARNTRYGQERAFGNGSQALLPLPERLYAGGASSFRAFGTNAAGPRDPDTGFPIGGAGALVNNVELRLPPPKLPYFGNTVSFVLFHDMGNVFSNSGDIWESALRYEQPRRQSCRNLTYSASPGGKEASTGPQGDCSFNYFNHAAGLGLRYHTPVGPIRMDFSYTLNPPIYPVTVNYSQKDPFANPHVGEGPHFNFFFSLGQTF